MMIQSPYLWLSPKAQKITFIIFFILTIILLGCLQIIDTSLQTEEAPMGIVSFQLAGDLSNSLDIIESWNDAGEETNQFYAGLSLGIDYLFMLAYAISIGLGCILLTKTLIRKKHVLSSSFLPSLSNTLAWGAIIAALLDVIGNYILIRLLLGSTSEMLPVISFWFATFKFLILGIALLYILITLIMIIIPVKDKAPIS